MEKRVALYVRVSTNEQKKHGLSVDSQITALSEWCAEKNYTIAGIYNDAGFSAHVSYKKRKAILQMIEDCQTGKIDLIIFTKLDRFFRSLPDYYAVMEQLNGVPWKAIWEDYETETSAGVFKVNIMLSIAQAEAERTSERIKSVFEYKRARGDYVGTPPIGYKRVDKKLVKDEKTAEQIEVMFHTYLTTLSTAKTVEALQALGLSPNANAVRKRLKSTAYCGDAYGHPCPAYITREQHDFIVNKMANYSRTPKEGNREYIFSGLCFCGYCGNRMHAKYSPNKNKFGNISPCKYYVCTGKINSSHHTEVVRMAERKLEKYLLKHLETVINGDMPAGVLVGEEIDVDAKIERLNGKLERVGIRFEDGDYTIEEYKAKKAEILADIAELENQRKPVDKIELPSSWRETYEMLDETHRRAFWAEYLDGVILKRGEDPIIKVKH